MGLHIDLRIVERISDEVAFHWDRKFKYFLDYDWGFVNQDFRHTATQKEQEKQDSHQLWIEGVILIIFPKC